MNGYPADEEGGDPEDPGGQAHVVAQVTVQGTSPGTRNSALHGLVHLDDRVDEPSQMEDGDEVEPHQPRRHPAVGRMHVVQQGLEVEQEEEPGQQEIAPAG